MEIVKKLPKFEYFTVILKNRNIISKIRRSKDTDCAALNDNLIQALFEPEEGEIVN